MRASLRSDFPERYARHLALAEIGPRGQQRLRRARVLLVGLGALGSPAALYLAATGIGTIGLADYDQVRLANLQHQVIHRSDTVGESKVRSAATAIRSLNPDVDIEEISASIDERNAIEVLSRYDVVVDGTDTFHARYLLSDAAFLTRRPLVHGSVFRTDGQVTVFKPGSGCYRCLYPEPPPAGMFEDAAEVGLFNALAGVIGTIQAAEVMKLITGAGEPLVNRVLLHDALAMTFREVRYRRNPACPLCGDRPVILRLMDAGATVPSGAGR